MTPNEIEELRYDVAHHLLSKMSVGSQFQYALDRMLQICNDYSEEKLKKIMLETEKKTKRRGF